MKAGLISRDGFLGKDQRNLIDILDDDDQRVKAMDLTHSAIAKRMKEFLNEASLGLGDPVEIGRNFIACVESHRGRIPCPFGHPGIFRKTIVRVQNKKLSKEIQFTELSIHLIGAHGFYQGRGARYRIEPEHLAAVLEIRADKEEVCPDE